MRAPDMRHRNAYKSAWVCILPQRQSLTFVGERHEIRLRIPPPDSEAVVSQLVDGLEDAELEVGGHFVADIAIVEGPLSRPDGSVELGIEALTVADS